MTDIASLGLKVDSRGVIVATDSLSKLERQGASAEKATDSLTRSSRLLSSALASVGTALSARQVIAYSDAYTQARNQIKLTTDSQAEQVAIQEKLLGISNRTATELGSSAELYATLSRNTDGLNLSQNGLLEVVELVNKSFYVTGKSSAEASGAIRQLSQAFSKGKLNGDEFVSVAEGAPEILRAIQKEAGKTKAELTAMAADGEITAELLVTALRNYRGELDKAAANVENAFGSKMTIANNNITAYVGGVESATGAVGAFGDVIVGLSENLDNVATVAQGVGLIFAGRLAGSLAAGTKAAFAHATAQLTMVPAITKTNALMAAQAASSTRANVAMNALTLSAKGLRTAFSFLGGAAGLVTMAAGAFFLFRDSADEATASIKSFIDEADKAKSISNLNQKIKETEERIESLSASVERARGNMKRGFNLNIAGAKKELADLKAKLEELSSVETEAAKSASQAAASKAKNSLNSLERLRDQLIQQEAVLGLSEAATLRYRLELGDLSESVKSLGSEGERLTSVIVAQAESLEKSKKALDEERAATDKKLAQEKRLSQSYKELTSSLTEQSTQLLLSNKELFVRQNLIKLGADATDDMKLSVRELSESLYDQKDALATASLAAERLADEQLQQQQSLQRQYQDTAEKINDAFTGTFRSLLDGGRDTFGNLVDTAKSAVKDIIAELLTLAARPFIIQIAGASAGLISGQANAEGLTGALGGGYDVADLASGVKSLFGGNGIGQSFTSAGQFLQSSFGGANGAFLAANPSYAAATSQGALFSGAGGFSNLAYGGTGLIAGLLGDKLFGGQGGAGASLGSTIGLAAGGPIGAAIGGLLGGAVGRLFGSGKPSDKTQAVGVNLASGSIRQLEGGTGKKFSQENLDYSKSTAEYVAQYSKALALITQDTLDNQLEIRIGNRDGLRLLVDGVQKVNESSSDAFIRSIESTLADMYDANVDFYNDIALENETLLATFQRVELQTGVLSSAVELMGVNIGATGQDLDSFADSMTKAAGGLQNVDALWSGYFEGFYSDQERATKALVQGQNKLNDFMQTAGLDGLNLTLDNFRAKFEDALAGGLSAAQTVDWLTAGQFMVEVDKLATSLPGVVSASSSLSSLFSNLQTAVDAEKAAINARYNSVASNAASKISVLDENLNSVLSGISSRQSAITAASRAAQSQFSSSISNANASLSNANSILSVLNSALDGLNSTSGSLLKHNRAQQTLIDLAASGGVPDGDVLRSAISGASNPSTDLFATFTDFRKDALITANALSTLKDNTVDQLSVDEQVLARLQNSAAIAESQFSTRMAALNAQARDAEKYHDEQVSLISDQLDLEQSIRDDAIAELDATLNKWDSLLDISGNQLQATQSVADAVNSLSSAFKNQSSSATSAISNSDFVSSLYTKGLGRDADSQGLSYWLDMLNGGKSKRELVSIFGSTALRNGELFDSRKIPAFASGGSHSGGMRIVGENGPELEFTGPSYVASNSQSKKLLDMSEVVQVVRELTEIVKNSNAALISRTIDLTKIVDGWDKTGMPVERTF